jgi:hypothetical protein
MKHLASTRFWSLYDGLPKHVRELADKNFALLKENPQHPSLHLKKVGRFWSARVGNHYRALATDMRGHMHWHWIGPHSVYDKKTRG